jgi:hypothetical protein
MTTRTAPRPRLRPHPHSRALLRPTPRPETAAQLVADIIHHKVEAAKQKQAARVAVATKRRRRARGWYFLVALPLLLGLTAWNLVRAAHPPEVFSADERESGVRLRMYLAAQAVEAYRDSLGRWPAQLDAVGFGDAGFVYRAGGSSFEISDTSALVPLTYHRGDMLAPFADAYQELKQGGGP